MKPTVTISLKPYLQDYLYKIFPQYQDSIAITRRHSIGKIIYSVVCASDLPQKRPFIETPISIILPDTKKTDLKDKFLYVSGWGEERIQEYIQADFDLVVKIFFEKGYSKGYSQKRIIEAFMAGFNIKNNALSYEAIKKNDYRRRKKSNKLLFNELQNADY